MPNKKHYWTQVFITTTLMSCALGLASGFVYSAQKEEQAASQRALTNEDSQRIIETQWAELSFAPNCPLGQPGTRMLTSGVAVQGKNLRLEGIPRARSRIHCTLDATPIAIQLLLFAGLATLLIRKIFEQLVTKQPHVH